MTMTAIAATLPSMKRATADVTRGRCTDTCYDHGRIAVRPSAPRWWQLPEIVNRTAGGCVVVGVTPGGTLFLDFVALNPGWTYTVESGGGTKGRGQLSFDGPGGQEASIRVEPGKTVIK